MILENDKPSAMLALAAPPRFGYNSNAAKFRAHLPNSGAAHGEQ
jgi:hypothetical protein